MAFICVLNREHWSPSGYYLFVRLCRWRVAVRNRSGRSEWHVSPVVFVRCAAPLSARFDVWHVVVVKTKFGANLLPRYRIGAFFLRFFECENQFRSWQYLSVSEVTKSETTWSISLPTEMLQHPHTQEINWEIFNIRKNNFAYVTLCNLFRSG